MTTEKIGFLIEFQKSYTITFLFPLLDFIKVIL